MSKCAQPGCIVEPMLNSEKAKAIGMAVIVVKAVLRNSVSDMVVDEDDGACFPA